MAKEPENNSAVKHCRAARDSWSHVAVWDSCSPVCSHRNSNDEDPEENAEWTTAATERNVLPLAGRPAAHSPKTQVEIRPRAARTGRLRAQLLKG